MTDKRSGGPYDRGQADAYYGAPFRPHYFTGLAFTSQEVTELTAEELADYRAGFNDQQESGDFKDWGGPQPWGFDDEEESAP